MPMRVKLYLDVFFLINTGMNLVVFLTQSLLMQKTIRLWRLILASILGAVMACLLVLFHVHRNLLLLVLSYFFVSVFLVRFAFGKMTTARTVMHLLLYYACAFILAGLMLLLLTERIARGRQEKDIFATLVAGAVAALVAIVLRSVMIVVVTKAFHLEYLRGEAVQRSVTERN